MEKPEILSDEQILKLTGLENFQDLFINKIIAQAQRDDTYKKTLEQFKEIFSSLIFQMRDIGGRELEWAISNKEYQDIQSQLEEE